MMRMSTGPAAFGFWSTENVVFDTRLSTVAYTATTWPRYRSGCAASEAAVIGTSVAGGAC